jgi:hypothetical protein
MGVIWLRARSLVRLSLFGWVGRGERGLIIGSVWGVGIHFGGSGSDIFGCENS